MDQTESVENIQTTISNVENLNANPKNHQIIPLKKK